MKVKVPKKITIGAYDYKILLLRKLVYDYRLLGQSLPDSQIIKVEYETSQQTKVVTLWHELVHSIGDVYNCGLEEANIDRIAQAIAAMLQKDFNLEFDWSEIDKPFEGGE